jgi:hypothetical protein
MPTINQLSSTSSLSGGDQLPVYDASEGDARKASLSTLLAFFQDNFASPEFETVTAAPSSSGFTVSLDASTENIWAILNPTGAFAAGTIELPPVADCFDGQIIVVVCSQAVTALTVSGNGATVAGAPSGLGTNGFFSLRFQESADKWWCTSQSLGATSTFSDLTLTGVIKNGDGETVLAFAQEGVGTAVNYPTLVYSTSTNEVAIAATGSDTNIDFNVIPKGAGSVNIGGGSTNQVNLTADNDINLLSSNGDLVLEATTGTINAQSRVVHATAPVLPNSTVAALPSPAVIGMLAVVTDATATTHHSIVAGGGANDVVVFYDGTNWRIA